MSVDRSGRTLAAIFLLVTALFLGMNRVVASAPLGDWWLPLVLLILGIGLLLLGSANLIRVPAELEAAETPAVPPPVPAGASADAHVYRVAAESVPRLQTMTIRPDPELETERVVTVTDQTGAVLPFVEKTVLDSAPVTAYTAQVTPAPAAGGETTIFGEPSAPVSEPESVAYAATSSGEIAAHASQAPVEEIPVMPAPEPTSPETPAPVEAPAEPTPVSPETPAPAAEPEPAPQAPPASPETADAATAGGAIPVDMTAPINDHAPVNEPSPQTPLQSGGKFGPSQYIPLEREGDTGKPAPDLKYTARTEYADPDSTTAKKEAPAVPPPDESVTAPQRTEPEKEVVIEKTAAPQQPYEADQIGEITPERTDRTINGENTDENDVPAVSETSNERVAAGARGDTTVGSADDLRKLRGIGRKSAEALRAAGIDSFHKLANSTDDAIRSALEAGGVRLVGEVDTWRQQASYAARGDWQGLDRFNTEQRPASGD